MSKDKVYLKPNAIVEPLINQWYAWSYLVPPATAARYIADYYIKILESFIEAPQVHQSALKNPAMLGGPFINYDASRVDEIKDLLARTKVEQANLLKLARAIQDLDQLLREKADGYSLEPLYEKIPEELKGYVELVYDTHNHPSIRFIESLLYRCSDYQSAHQTVALSLSDEDSRSFVLSTPRLPDNHTLHLNFRFNNPVWDRLFRMRYQADSYDEIKQIFDIKNHQEAVFSSLFTTEQPPQPNNYQGDDVRVRYFGHACVLIETQNTTILCDPLISYQHRTGITRYTYADLPEVIDYAVITHNHQDHVMFETLLQLRHKIRNIVVPKGNKGALIDPSLKLVLEQIGFNNVKEIDELETIELKDGYILALPFLGEHGDLNIATKAAYWFNIKGRKILCAADSNNIEPALYQNLHCLLGDLDIMFIGMECDGAPYTWAYDALLMQSVPRKKAQTRRLDGSDGQKAINLVNQFHPQQAYVYAMGQEPWLVYITSIIYTDDSRPIVESNKLVEFCKQIGIHSERLYGCKEIILTAGDNTNLFVQSSISNNKNHQKSSTNSKQTSIVLDTVVEPKNKPIEEFLQELSGKDIKLWIEDNQDTSAEPKLKCNAPKGALTKEIKTQIKERKAEIVQFLQERSNDSKVDLEAEAVLDESIQPENVIPSTVSLNDIFLTGATGFIGAFLLYELLQTTEAKIHCLIRADNTESARDKIKKSLQDYQKWQDSFSNRIIPVVGDLSKPLLGLSQSQFENLATEIDTIYHNGAWVHHTLPYSQLKAANVLGTQEIIRLACKNQVKPLHFISTISVFAGTNQTILENEPLDINRSPVGGYAQSKWVAEKLVTIARQRNLPVSIYRVGAVSGDSQTGVFNRNDFLYKMIQGCVQLGSAPIGNMMLDIMPVDYVSQAIIYLSKQSESWGKVFHLVHPQPVSVDVLFAQLNSMGYPVQRLPYEQWREQLVKIIQHSPNHPLYAIASLFSANSSDRETDIKPLQFDTRNTLAGLANTSIICPEIDAQLLTTYISYLMK
ncbi:MAG: thioester reductase domain-containing protein [Cyanobacteria bacterium J06633_8]